MTVESDEDLARRAARGNQHAFDTLARRHYAALAQAARGMGVPETDIDDVVQETWIAVWANLPDFDPDRPFRVWLTRVGLNKVRDHLRFRRVRAFFFGAVGLDRPEADAVEDPSPLPARHLEAHSQLARTVALLDRLAPEQREVLVLTAFVGLSCPEAADALGITVKAVEGRLVRARSRLAAWLDEPPEK